MSLQFELSFSSTMPTEPGTYLFVGSPDIRRECSPVPEVRPEVVRIAKDGSGKVRPFGLSFFSQDPADIVGQWAPLDSGLSPVYAEVQPRVNRAVALRRARAAFRGCPPGASLYRWEVSARSDLRDGAFTWLLESGVIEPDPNNPDKWALAETTRCPDPETP